MSSLRRRLIIGGALTTMLVVGVAAAAVAAADHLLSLRAVDRGLEAEMRSARFRGVMLLLFEQREDRGERDGEEPRGPPADADNVHLVLSWSIPDPARFAHSRELDPSIALQIRRHAASGTTGLTLPDGRRLRLLRQDLDELPRMPRRWRGGEAPELATPVAVVLAHDISGVHAGLRQRQLLLAATVAAATLLAALGAWILSRSLLRPLARLGDAIASTTAGPDATAIQIPDAPTELRPVIDRLNQLLDRVASALRRERRVNADIAHELRTPLAGLRSQLEFALQGEVDPIELRSAAETALAIGIQMQELMENLLTLVRLDADQLSLRNEILQPDELVAWIWQALAPSAAARQITLSSSLDPAHSLVADRARLQVVLSNLLGNAVAHAPHGSSVEVTREADDLLLSNPAVDLDPETAEHALEPFWRGDSARSDTGLHCGLGLSIASRLCQAMNGSLTLSVTPDRFTARVQLPQPLSANEAPFTGGAEEQRPTEG